MLVHMCIYLWLLSEKCIVQLVIAMLQSIPVIDETNNYRLWEHIQMITWFQILLARNKIIPPLIPVNSHVKLTNDNPVLKLPRALEIQSYTWWCFGNYCLMAWFNLTLTPTILYSIVAININSCSVIIT